MQRKILTFSAFLALFGVFCLSQPARATRLDPMITYAAGSNPRGLAVGDLNGDGKVDVVVANFGAGTLIGQATTQAAGTLQVYKGSADGLVPWMLLPSGKSPRSVVIADLNGDGRLDIAASFYDDNAVGVYLQQADGSFSGPGTVTVGTHPVGLAVATVDGRPALAVANYDSDSVSFMRVVGAAPAVISTLALTAGSHPTDVKFYQSTPTAATQLLVADYGLGSMTRLTVRGDGTLVSSSNDTISGQPCKIVVGDFNGDGHLDAAVAQFSDNKVTVFLGQADGSLGTAGTASALQGQHPNGLAYGPLGATGRLIAADRDSDQVDLLQWTPQGMSSTAALTVPDAQGNTGGGYGPIEVAVADVNGDGLADLLVTDMRTGELKLFPQRGTAAPVISSTTHPDQRQWYGSTNASLSWVPPADLDPITQYLTVFDQKVGTFPQAGQGPVSATGVNYASLASGTYYLHVRAVDAAGRLGDTGTFKVGVTAALSRENVYNYPNPSRDGNTTIRFPLVDPAPVQIKIYDETGQLVWTRDLSAGDTIAGVNQVLWDGHNGNGQAVGNGGYIFTLTSGSFSVTKKIAIVR
jgi:hypothetical protein